MTEIWTDSKLLLTVTDNDPHIFGCLRDGTGCGAVYVRGLRKSKAVSQHAEMQHLVVLTKDLIQDKMTQDC